MLWLGQPIALGMYDVAIRCAAELRLRPLCFLSSVEDIWRTFPSRVLTNRNYRAFLCLVAAMRRFHTANGEADQGRKPGLGRFCIFPHSQRVSSIHHLPGLLGHETVQQMLQRAMSRKMLHHALLVTGQQGIGKSVLARGLACALLCPVQPNLGCGTCVACNRVLNGTHSDLAIVHGEGKSRQIKRDQIRELVVRCQSAPFEGSAHLVILDPADGLTIDAANVLLKTLEEPMPGVYFALLAENPDAVLPTLRSRSLAVPLGPLSDALVEQIVSSKITSDDRAQTSSESMAAAIHLAQGSPGIALRLLGESALSSTQDFLREILAACAGQMADIFGGDKSPLWLSFTQACADATDPDVELEEPVEPEVVQISGKKVGSRKKKSSSRSKEGKEDGDGKQTPAQQRLAVFLMSDLWQVQLREALRGEHAFPTLLDLRKFPPEVLVVHLRQIDLLHQRLAANANVRIALELALVAISQVHRAHVSPPLSTARATGPGKSHERS